MIAPRTKLQSSFVFEKFHSAKHTDGFFLHFALFLHSNAMSCYSAIKLSYENYQFHRQKHCINKKGLLLFQKKS